MELPPVTKKIIAFGSKQVFLPKFTIALCRTPKLSPYFAKFQVPLNFSKYDLRDYLYHAYAVKVHSIRSIVKQMPVRTNEKQPRHWFREESKKYMTVEMEKPFVWPETPKSFEEWGKKEQLESFKQSVANEGVKLRPALRAEAEQLRKHALKVLGKKKREPRVKKAKAEEAVEEKENAGEEVEEGALTAARAKRETPKRKNPLKLWKEQRTPWILNHERLPAKNFAGLMQFKPKDLPE